MGKMVVREMAVLEEEIMEALDQEIDEEAAEQGEFVIDSMDKLDWAIRKVAVIEKGAEQKIECARRQILRLQEYIRRVNENTEKNTARFKTMMEPFVKTLLEGGKRKSFDAPSGTVGFRVQEPEFEKDDESLVKWLKESGKRDLVKVKESVDWAILKKQLVDVMEDGTCVTVDGELIPVEAIRATKRPDKLYVKPRI